LINEATGSGLRSGPLLKFRGKIQGKRDKEYFLWCAQCSFFPVVGVGIAKRTTENTEGHREEEKLTPLLSVFSANGF
jgi:hypothetical protein